jgi:two-component system response regulator FlrC
MIQKSDIRAVWLDPYGPLPAPATALFAALGWTVTTVRTLDALADAARAAEVVVVRLIDDASILQDARAELRQAGLALPMVCRLDAGALAMAGAVARAGIDHILGAADWSPAAWRSVSEALSRPARVAVRPRPAAAVFEDASSRLLLDLALRVGRAQVTALIVGPTGTGKEVLARVLHECSPRASGPFCALNCAAMPEQLVEDVLFGHEKGAFTGATRDHPGLFEQAHGGTLFLDEIGEMSFPVQSKLLRVLQEREVTRLGGQAPLSVDVRIVAATNKDLKRAIAAREFREDLYYRIATFQLRLLPLARRPGDILPLASRFLAEQARVGQAWILSPQAQARLLSYPWPGNVRELQNVMLRATVVCPGGYIEAAHLMFDSWDAAPEADDESAQPFTPSFSEATHEPALDAPLASGAASGCPTVLPGTWAATAPGDLHSATKHNEHRVIMAALAECGTRTEAARRLGISARTLRYKLAQLRDIGLVPVLSD